MNGFLFYKYYSWFLLNGRINFTTLTIFFKKLTISLLKLCCIDFTRINYSLTA